MTTIAVLYIAGAPLEIPGVTPGEIIGYRKNGRPIRVVAGAQNQYQEIILWVGVGIVIIFILTNTSFKSLLTQGGNKGTNINSGSSSSGTTSPTTNKSTGATTCPPGYTYDSTTGKCLAPEAL